MADSVTPVVASAPDIESGSQKDITDSKAATMRKAGEEYFQKALQQTKRPLATARARRRRNAEDPDVLEFGIMIESGKLFFLGAVFVCAQAVGVCALKVRTKMD